MKLGLGLYRHALTRDNFQFARQAGATHIVAHLLDYFQGGAHNPDHTPQMTCGAPWHAGMAFALGYMRAALQAIGQE